MIVVGISPNVTRKVIWTWEPFLGAVPKKEIFLRKLPGDAPMRRFVQAAMTANFATSIYSEEYPVKTFMKSATCFGICSVHCCTILKTVLQILLPKTVCELFLRLDVPLQLNAILLHSQKVPHLVIINGSDVKASATYFDHFLLVSIGEETHHCKSSVKSFSSRILCLRKLLLGVNHSNDLGPFPLFH